MKNLINKIKNNLKNIPNKKSYLELITAALTVPVLITVLLNNISSLNRSKNEEKSTNQIEITTGAIPEKSMESTDREQPTSSLPVPTSSPIVTVYTTGTECKKEVGPVEIVYPQDSDIVSKDPLCIDITRKQGEYCSVVWSYRINNEPWSDYTDKSICLYGLTPGSKILELRIKSIVSSDEVVIKRKFTVLGPTFTPTPQVSTTSGILY